MNIRNAPGCYLCASCGLVLEFLGGMDGRAGYLVARCCNRFCDQFGETAVLASQLISVASTNTIRTWPADAP